MSSIGLYNEDCLNWLKNAANTGTTVDAVVCDLPYFGVVDEDFDNQWSRLYDYLAWIDECLFYCQKILKKGGNLLLFCSRQNIWEFGRILDSLGFEENRTIIWARKRSFNNTRGKALASGYEPILFWSNGKSETFNNIKVKVDSKRKEYTEGTLKDGVTLSDVWTDIPALPHNAKEKVKHPTQKPVALMERIVSLFTNEGDTVLDFCMGSGSTGVACKNINRNFIGVEISENYFNIAKERLYEEDNVQ